MLGVCPVVTLLLDCILRCLLHFSFHSGIYYIEHWCVKFPKGKLGIFDVALLSGISGLSFDSSFLFPLWFFYIVLLLFFLVIFLLVPAVVHTPRSCLFSPETFSALFIKLFCMALVENLGDDSW